MNSCPDLSRRCIETYRECGSVDKTCAVLGVHPMTVWRALKFGQVALNAGTILESQERNRRAWLDTEKAFARLVPEAESANDLGLNNPGFDFMCRGWRIEVKFCAPTSRQKWVFQFCRYYQSGYASERTDFFVAFMNQSPILDLDSCTILVIPAELLGDRRVFSWSCKRPATHWSRFILPKADLRAFFAGLPDKAAFEAAHVEPEAALTDFQRRANEKVLSDDDKKLMVALSGEGLDADEIAPKFAVRKCFVERMLACDERKRRAGALR